MCLSLTVEKGDAGIVGAERGVLLDLYGKLIDDYRSIRLDLDAVYEQAS